MRFAVNVPNFGAFGDPRAVADLARRAEEAGWDALFVWDHVTWVKARNREIADPWVLLTAAALATSAGRMILGVGLGAPVADEYGSFGDTTDVRKLATRLDEGLFVLNKLWSGVVARVRLA
jgi:alkanesulfonate monooxygenase SsuD/methylene tetrahydromethanopterin reductase-like flavin-dependent oxidoreductase (luciferase family)